MSKPPECDLSGFGLERLQHIGRGQYASAQLVRETDTGTNYVAKCVSLEVLNDHDQELAHQEVFLLQTLRHPYIVSYRDSFLIEGTSTLVIVMEYCDSGDLRKAIKEKTKCSEHFSEDQVMTWFVQLSQALQFIHSEKVLHRDLKTSNIFLSQGPQGVQVKLGDFGISRVLEGTTEAAVTIVGTPYYMSPEVCRSEPYNWKSDIWALGCVLYELCMLKHAFESSSLLGLVYKIVSDHYEPIPSFYSQELNGLICQLLMKSADERPSINDMFTSQYVKAFLVQQAPPAPSPPPAAEVSDALALPRPPRAASLRPGGSPAPAPPPPPPPAPPGPPQLGPEHIVLVIASRIRRRLVGQRLNWVAVVAPLDVAGEGNLPPEDMRLALMSMQLGLSEAEMGAFCAALMAQSPSGKISLDLFGSHLRDVAPEVKHLEAWARQACAPAGPQRIRHLLAAKDMEQKGTLSPEIFREALRELAPSLSIPQADQLLLLADKNGLGDIDYAEFIGAFGVPLAPPGAEQPPPIAPAPVARVSSSPTPPGMPPLPPGMPPLPGAPAAPQRPAGMPPLPGSPGAAAPDFNMTLTMGDIAMTPRTFFTCNDLFGNSSASGAANVRRQALSPEGCLLVFSRIRRRLDAVGLSISDVLSLFTNPGERELTAEQFLDAASSLPLGTSRAEMQQLFDRVDSQRTGRISFEALEAGVKRAAVSECSKAPPWIAVAMQNGLGGRVRDELKRMQRSGGPTLCPEGPFRRVVMQSERYLTSDQLNSLLLLTDKNANGHLDYDEFAERFSGGGGALRIPGGVLPPPAALPAVAASSDEECRTVASRTGAVLERNAFAPARLPALLSLWGGSLQPDMEATLLAQLPLGMSQTEVAALLRATGGVDGLAALVSEVGSQGMWKARCEWAATVIPGPKLRDVLQNQVLEAETRTLDHAEFRQLLVSAGVKDSDTAAAIWLAEKKPQGAICVAEFLANFGGPPPASKKKKGLFQRMWGR